MMKHLTFLALFFPFLLFSQQTKSVDFKTGNASLTINSGNKTISGVVKYDLDVFSKIDTIRIDAKNMTFTDVKINNKKVDFSNSGQELKLFKGFKKGKNILTFDYQATPKQTLYFVGEDDGKQIWTQGQGKYTSHWLPSFDDENEKVIFNNSITFASDFEVVSNGVLAEKTTKDSLTTWNFKMQHPMSSYLVMLAIGKFEKQTLKTNSGKPLELYIRAEDVEKFEPTYRYSKQIFDFFEKEIGVPYPWKIYRQIPVKDFLYAGMETLLPPFLLKILWLIPLVFTTEITSMSMLMNSLINGLVIWLQQNQVNTIGSKKVLLRIMHYWLKKRFLAPIISIGIFMKWLND